MFKIFVIGAGGFCGAVLRYLISAWVHDVSGSRFPLGTMVVNCLGCLILGVVSGMAEQVILDPSVKIFLTIGLLGALTTFSTFTMESLIMVRRGSTFSAFLYIFVSLGLGMFAAYSGFAAARAIR